MTQKHSVFILGLGKIGLTYDLHSSAENFFSHTKTFSKHPAFSLKAAADPNAKARETFQSVTKDVPVFADLNEVPDSKFDVVVIANPTELHASSVEECLRFRPKLILLEKPVAASRKEAEKIRAHLQKEKIACFVNYIRRADPGFAELRSFLQSKKLGEFQGGYCVYGRGLLNFASHYIDLLNFLLGAGKIGVFLENTGWHRPAVDPEPAFSLKYQEKDITFNPVGKNSYDAGEMDLFFSQGRVRLTNFCEKIELFTPQANTTYEGYKSLAPANMNISTDMQRYQWNVAEAIDHFFRNGTPLPSTLDSAMESLNICLEITKHA